MAGHTGERILEKDTKGTIDSIDSDGYRIDLELYGPYYFQLGEFNKVA